MAHLKQERKQENRNEILQLAELIEEKTEGLCRIGTGAGGIGVSTDHQAYFSVYLEFDPPLLQEEELFSKQVEQYQITVCAYDEMDKRMTIDELEELTKGENPVASKVAKAVLALSKTPLHVSAETCQEAFSVLTDRQMQEIYGEKEYLPMSGMILL